MKDEQMANDSVASTAEMTVVDLVAYLVGKMVVLSVAEMVGKTVA